MDETSEDRRAPRIYPQGVFHRQVDPCGSLVVIVRNAVVVMIPITGWFCDSGWVSLGVQSFTGPTFLEYIIIQIFPSVIVVVIVNRIGTGRGIQGVGNTHSVAEVVVVPWVCGLPVETGWPEHYLILILHAILIVVVILVVPQTIVVVVPGRY